MLIVDDPDFALWLKKNNFIITIDENNKNIKKFMNKFGSIHTIHNLPIVSKHKIKQNLKTPNLLHLQKGKFQEMYPDLKSTKRKINRLLKIYLASSKFGITPTPLPNWAGNAIGCNKFGYLQPSSKISYMNHRGSNGFENVPKGIYKSEGGNVYDYTYSPYAGNKINWRPPRPNGPRDQATMKDYPNIKTSFGNVGFVGQTSQFRPHIVRNWNPGYTTYANDSLYINKPTNLKTIKSINQKKALQSNYGPLKGAPNNYRTPFLMYPGSGSNTIDLATKKNFLPPCNTPNNMKVKQNNNPTGWLSSNAVKPLNMKSSYGIPFNTQYIDGPVTGTGVTRIGQPLKLYKSQQENKSGVYPEYLDTSRAFRGGYGKKKKKIGEGDTVIISKKGVTVKKR